MPFTYFAHQVPVLPLKMRQPDRWDGLALVVGSMVPDFWYVTTGWGRGPWGISLEVNAHGVLQPARWVLPSLVIVWLVRRIVAPVVPLALPRGGEFHLHDYRLLAESHHRWWVTAYSAMAGAITHGLLDAFTHREGFVVTAIPAMSATLFELAGKRVTLFSIGQFGGSLVGGVIAVWLLARVGRDRLMCRWHGYDPTPGSGSEPPTVELTRSGVVTVRVGVVIGAGVGAAYALLRLEHALNPMVTRFAGITLLGGIVGALVARHDVRPTTNAG